MTATTIASEAALPPIHIIDSEYNAIATWALRDEIAQPDVAHDLMRELERAEIHAAGDLPPGVVTLNARVDFIDEGSGTHRSVQLVMPPEADIAAGKISILTPVGAGLIGMVAGNSILWPDRVGHARTLRVVSVAPPAKPHNG